MSVSLPSLTQTATSPVEGFPPGSLVAVIIAGFLLAVMLTISVKVGGRGGIAVAVISTILLGAGLFFFFTQSAYNETRAELARDAMESVTNPDIFVTTNLGPAVSPTILLILLVVSLLLLLPTVVAPEAGIVVGFALVIVWAVGWFLASGFDEAPSTTEMFTSWLTTHHADLELGAQAGTLISQDAAYAANGDTYRLVPVEGDVENAYRLLRLNETPETPVGE